MTRYCSIWRVCVFGFVKTFQSMLKNVVGLTYWIRNVMLTLPLSTLRAADSSDCGITPFSAPKVLTTDDTAEGIDNPCEFSARTRNMYDVAGLSSPICKMKSKFVKMSNQFFFLSLSLYTAHSLWEIIYFRDRIKCKISNLFKYLVSSFHVERSLSTLRKQT